MLLGVAKFLVLKASMIHINASRATKVKLRRVPIRALFRVAVNRTASAASALILLSTLIVGYPPEKAFPRLLSFGVRRRLLLLKWFRGRLFHRYDWRPAFPVGRRAECHKYRKPPAGRRKSG